VLTDYDILLEGQGGAVPLMDGIIAFAEGCSQSADHICSSEKELWAFARFSAAAIGSFTCPLLKFEKKFFCCRKEGGMDALNQNRRGQSEFPGPHFFHLDNHYKTQ
jgi:hypothetical protein